jgi:hypothetical protein
LHYGNSNNFKYLNDEEYDITEKIVKNIREKLTNNLNGQRLVEKSPINSLRPYLVHAVFPDAKIVYLEREPVRCIYSNYIRSLKKDSFKLSIILKKYFILYRFQRICRVQEVSENYFSKFL